MKPQPPLRNFAYVTAVTTDSYLLGALALKISLKLSRTRYRLVAVVSDNVSQSTINIMNYYGIHTMRVRSVPVPASIHKVNRQVSLYSYWSHTFDKLTIFSLAQFDKLVYVDSDMLILCNIDALFERPHMSAVCAGQSFPGNEHWRGGLNSGLMVVEPQAGISEALLNCLSKLPTEPFREISDQDVLKLFYSDWSGIRHLELNESYNVFVQYIDYYIRHHRRTLKGERIKVVHFVTAEKPWMRGVGGQSKHILQLLRRRHFYEALFYCLYVCIINLIKIHVAAIEMFGHFPSSSRHQA